MFGLKIPIAQSERTAEFDSVSTILSHSSVARSSHIKKTPSWFNAVGDDGGIFHLELQPGLEAKLVRLNSGDGGSVDSLAFGNGCNSEDTGYSSDQDVSFDDHRSSSGCKRGSVKINATYATGKVNHSKISDSKTVNAALKKSCPSAPVKRLVKRSDISRLAEPQFADQLWVKTPQAQAFAFSFLEEEEEDRGVCLSNSDFRSSKGSTVSSRSSTSDTYNTTVSSHRATHRNSVRTNCASKRKLEYKTVNIDIQLNSTRSSSLDSSCLKSSGQTLSEFLLGIVPARSDGGETINNGQDTEVIIKSIVPGSPAYLKPEISVGSILHKIDGKEVTWDTMNALLLSLSKLKKVKLTLKSIRPEKSTVDLETLVNILTSDTDHHALDKMAAMYISLEGVNVDDPENTSDGMVYSFPSEQNSLHQLLGLFYTLAHLIKDINKSNTIKNTTLSLDGQMVHIAYMREGNDILVFAMPASCVRVSQLNTILLEFSRVLRVLFSSLETAFTKGLYSVFIDSLLTYLFRQVLSSPVRLSSASSSHSTTSHIEEKGNLQSECSSFVRCSQYVQAIPLSNEHMTMVGKKLSDFESSNFADMSENFYGCRRQYAILGSAFFYSGHLVCSHLATEDLHDLQVYLQHLGMMELMTRSSVAQFIVWREIFPSRFCHDVAEINNTFGYSEPSARWCWLIVGLKRGLFCCLLETVCPTLLHQNLLSPDIFYIDQAKACLMQIQTPQLLTMLDTRLNEDSHSTFAKSDYCATYVNTSCEKMTHIFNDEHKIKTRDGTHHRPYLETSWGRSSIGSDFSVNSVGTESLYKSLHRGKIYPIGTNGVTHLTSSAIAFSTVPSLHRLSKSQYPSIYQYCCLDGLEGTVILGSDMISSGIFHCEIVHCFYQCCRQIHDVFTTSADKRLCQADTEEDSTQFGTIKPDTHLKGMKEHGVLMTLKQSHGEGGHRNKETVEYWVVGRRLKRPYVREMYICFHASASQSVVELAFTHSFGSSL